MSSILEAANASADEDEFIIGKLPAKPGEVSIMTLEEAYIALGGLTNTGRSKGYAFACGNPGYDTSIYYMYAIKDSVGTNDAVSLSTVDNLQEVGLNWYKRLKRPDNSSSWTLGSRKVFGGPLDFIHRDSNNEYAFCWFYAMNYSDYSKDVFFWGKCVPGFVYVAVVRAKQLEVKYE